MEAVYHGVPMIALPIFGDQFYNAQRINAKRYGRVLDIRKFTENELYEAISDVMINTSYAETIQNCSKIFHSMPDPHTTLLFWVDHVLKFGSLHLRPVYMDLPLWKFLMVDNILFMMVMLLLIIWLASKGRRVVVNRLKRKNPNKVKKT